MRSMGLWSFLLVQPSAPRRLGHDKKGRNVLHGGGGKERTGTWDWLGGGEVGAVWN